MYDFNISKSTRITAGVVGIMMFFIVMFSVFYMAAEAGHECDEDNCPICACIQQCQDILHRLDNGVVPPVTFALAIALSLIAVLFFSCDITHKTLISKKVQLNN